MPPLNTWILPALIVGITQFASERPDPLEVRANSDSPSVEAVENASGERLRTSFRKGYDLTTRRGRERLYLFCSAKRARHVWFSSPCQVFGATSQSESRILNGVADASTWLPCPFCATTHCVQLETKCTAWYVRKDGETSCQMLCLGSARFSRKSTEPVLASFDHFSRVQRT